MSYHAPADFDRLKDDLTSLLISTAAAFGRNVGLEALDVEALCRQASGIEDTATELLTFGLNAWPTTSFDSTELPAPRHLAAAEAIAPPADGPLLFGKPLFDNILAKPKVLA